MARNDLSKSSPHDVLVAWQSGKISYHDALDLTASESLFELYQACRSSGVPLRKTFTEHELNVVEQVMADLEPTP